MQILVNGLIQGLLLSLVALGFALVYTGTSVFHLAQGAVYSATPFILLTSVDAGFGWLWGTIIAVFFGLILSCLFELANHWPLQKREASKEIHLIASLGTYIALVQLVAMIWGNQTRVLRPGIDTTFNLFGILLTRSQILGGVVSLLLLVGFFFWLQRTNVGLQFKALADNPIQLALMGYNIRLLRLTVFALSGFLTSVAALLMALDIGFGPHGGLQIVLLGMVATLIGGRGSFLGPLVGALLVGILRSQVVWYSSARWEEGATFFLLALFLMLRPQGLFGRAMRMEVES